MHFPPYHPFHTRPQPYLNIPVACFLTYILCKHNFIYLYDPNLSNRKYFTRVNGVDSKIGEIEIGVPQGSFLGPLLFLVFINDLSLAIKNSKTSLYADDTSIYLCPKGPSQLNKETNDDLDKLDEWLKANKLSLNAAKTRSMLFASQKKLNYLKCSNVRFDPKVGSKEIEI